jgi:hypothetical protein
MRGSKSNRGTNQRGASLLQFILKIRYFIRGKTRAGGACPEREGLVSLGTEKFSHIPFPYSDTRLLSDQFEHQR